MDEFLKFNEHGQWSLVKSFTLGTKQGGVRADQQRPDVGFRGKQGKMQVTDTNTGPKPKNPGVGRLGGAAGKASPHASAHASVTAESSYGDRGLQNQTISSKNV